MNIISKISIIAALATLASVSAFAQENSASESENYGKRVLVNRWFQNWEISGKIGTQAYMGEYCLTDFKFGDWWTLPAFDLTLSKWGTQSIGLAINFTASPFKSLYSANDIDVAQFTSSNDKQYSGNLNLAHGFMGNATISAIFDITNLFFGYKKDRFYNLVASVGGGMIFPLSKTKYDEVCASFNAGLINKFNVTKRLSLDVAVRGSLHDDMFNGISYYTSGDIHNLSVDATIGATVGVSYKFDIPSKKAKEKAKAERAIAETGWLTVSDIVKQTEEYKEVVAEADSVKEVAAATNDELVQTTKELETAKQEVIAVAAAYKADFQYCQLVNFPIDTWDLSNRERVAIMMAAQTIKANPDVKFLVKGFADKQTSNSKHNQFLSEQRANLVYTLLISEYGVNADQLEKSAHGGVDYMFLDDAQLSRSVLIITENLDKDAE